MRRSNYIKITLLATLFSFLSCAGVAYFQEPQEIDNGYKLDLDDYYFSLNFKNKKRKLVCVIPFLMIYKQKDNQYEFSIYCEKPKNKTSFTKLSIDELIIKSDSNNTINILKEYNESKPIELEFQDRNSVSWPFNKPIVLNSNTFMTFVKVSFFDTSGNVDQRSYNNKFELKNKKESAFLPFIFVN